MKKQTKSFISLVLILSMAIGLTMCSCLDAFASGANPDTPATINVGSAVIKPDGENADDYWTSGDALNAGSVFEGTGTSQGAWEFHYDKEANILYLNGLKLANAPEGTLIEADGDLNIILKSGTENVLVSENGESAIFAGDSENMYNISIGSEDCGENPDTRLLITGENNSGGISACTVELNNINITACTSGCCIMCCGLGISGGNIDLKSTESSAIYSDEGNITVSDACRLTVCAVEIDTAAVEFYDGEFTHTGNSEIYIEAPWGINGWSYNAETGISIESGRLTVLNSEYALYTDSRNSEYSAYINIKGGTVNISGCGHAIQSCGTVGDSSINISGGEILIESSPWTIASDTEIIFTDFMTITKGGKQISCMYGNNPGQTCYTIGPDTNQRSNEVEIKQVLPVVTYYYEEPAYEPVVTVPVPRYKSCEKVENCVAAKYTDLNLTAWYHDGIHFCVENGYMNGIATDKFAPNDTLSRAMIVTILWNIEGKPSVDYAMTFKDVAADTWYTEAIRWAQSTGVADGYNDNAFEPTDNVTREQLASILWRYAKYKKYDVSVGEDTNILSYDDAIGGISEYAVSAIRWACGAGIIQGIGSKLEARGNATRAQAACMVQRFCELTK